MGTVRKTPAGTFKVRWRDPSGQQRYKNFPTKREASAFLAETEMNMHRGTYVDPRAGRQLFGPYARRWLDGRSTELTTTAREVSIVRAHLIPKWGRVPLGKIDHSSVQHWLAQLGKQRSSATVRKCYNSMNAVMRTAVRDRIIAYNPCDDVQLPPLRRRDTDDRTISRDVFMRQLLPAIPDRHYALVALVGGTGLRWGECAGLRWDAIDLDHAEVFVTRTAVEVAGTVTVKPFPKSRAGRRVIPLPPFVIDALRKHRLRYGTGSNGEVFTNEAGGAISRTTFRSRVWRPALVRAGLLGKVVEVGRDVCEATWIDAGGQEQHQQFTTVAEAVREVARSAAGGLRFHDLRHSYATWLISDGVPVNDVQRVMGHEQASTTLNLYTHHSGVATDRIRQTFGSYVVPPAGSTAGDEEGPVDETGPDL